MKPSSELRQLTRRFLEAIAQGDTQTIDHLFARRADMLVIGTDPAEWWMDREAAYRALTTQMEEMGGGFPLVVGDPVAYEEGPVGWAADQPRLQMPDGAEIPFRFTAVYHKEEDGWKVVQTHASIGLRNEDALGKELSI